MALPGDLTTFELRFGEPNGYTDATGALALVGETGKLFTVDPSTNRPLNVTDVASGHPIIPKRVTVTIGEDGKASVSPLPHNGQASLDPTGWAYRVEWNIASNKPSPGNLTFVVPSGASADFDLLVPAATVPAVAISQPTVASVNGQTGAVSLDAADVGAATPGDLTAGLAAKQDAATLGADVAADATVRAAFGAQVAADTVAWSLGRPVALFDMTDTEPTLRNRIGVKQWEVPLVGGTFAKSTAEPGPFGPSLVLDGSTAFALNVGSFDPLDVGRYSDEFTVHMWALSTSAGSSTSRCMAALHNEGANWPARVWALYTRAPYYGGLDRFSPNIGCQDGPTPGYPFNKDYPSTGAQQVTNEWRMYTVTWKDGVATAYVDGVATGWTYTEPAAPFGQSLTYTKNPLNVGRPLNRSATERIFSIGAATGRNSDGSVVALNHDTGYLGGLAIFDRAATPAQIMHDRLATLRRASADDPIFRLDFAQSNSSRVTPTGTFEAPTYTTVEAPGGVKAVNTRGLTAYVTAAATDVSGGTDLSMWHLNGLNLSDFDHVKRGSGGIASGSRNLVFQPIDGLKFWQLRRITFLLNNSVAGQSPIQLALLVGGQWVITEQSWVTAASHASGGDWSAAEAFSYDVRPTAANWRDLTVTPGTTLAPAAAARTVDVPNGVVTGIGLYNTSISNDEVRVGKLRYWSR